MKRLYALAAAIGTTLLWSGSYIVNKIAFAQGVGPMTLSGARYVLAGLALMLLMRKPGEGKPLPIKYALAQGAVCFVLGQGCQYIGQKLMTPTVASLVLNAMMVLFIVAADRLRLKESPGKGLYWEIALLLAGMVMYYLPATDIREAFPVAGVLFMLLAAFGSAMNVVCNRYMLSVKGIERRSLTLYPMLWGGLMMLGLGVLTEAPPPFSWTLALCVAYLALLSGALGFGLWVWSQQSLTAVQSGSINNGMLIEIALLDVLCFGRVLLPLQWAGVLVVFAAITLLQTGRVLARS